MSAAQRTDTPSPLRRARAQFSINPGDDSSSSSDDAECDEIEEQQEVTKLVRGLSLNIDPCYSPVPFPQLPGSDPPSPIPSSTPLSSDNSSPSISRNQNSTIILSNGKPLKSSLKSASTPHLPNERNQFHTRATSAPSTPFSQTKNVHFKDEKDGSLESVRIFNKAGRPVNINYGSGNEETETENETDSNACAFPPAVAIPSKSALLYRLADPPNTSAVPALNSHSSANVHLESITVPPNRPPLLRGTVLVRNITFAKLVAIRFTFDDWQTTSETTAHYLTSLPSLPPPFGVSLVVDPESPSVASPSWDWATTATQNALWDRFSFTIKLEDVERKLLEKKMFIAVRYHAQGHNGGEWWDNNGGSNYQISFKSHLSRPIERPSPIPAYKPKVNEMFNVSSTSPSFPPSGRPKSNSFAYQFPTRPGLTSRSHSNPTVPTFLSLGQINKPAPFKSKLRLTNYAAPTHDEEEDLLPQRPTITSTELTTAPPPRAIVGVSTITANSEPSGTPKKPSNTISDRWLSNSDTANDSYSQLVKNFCFHQSAPSAGSSTSTPLKDPWQGPYGGQYTMLMSL